MSRSVYVGASVVYIHFLVLRMEDSIIPFLGSSSGSSSSRSRSIVVIILRPFVVLLVLTVVVL